MVAPAGGGDIGIVAPAGGGVIGIIAPVDGGEIGIIAPVGGEEIGMPLAAGGGVVFAPAGAACAPLLAAEPSPVARVLIAPVAGTFAPLRPLAPELEDVPTGEASVLESVAGALAFGVFWSRPTGNPGVGATGLVST